MLAIIPPPKIQPSSNQTSIQGTLQVALPIQYSLPKVTGTDGKSLATTVWDLGEVLAFLRAEKGTQRNPE